jgi:hypothetical protein
MSEKKNLGSVKQRSVIPKEAVLAQYFTLPHRLHLLPKDSAGLHFVTICHHLVTICHIPPPVL